MIKPTDQELKTFACEWWHKFGFVKDKATCTWSLDEVSPEHFVDFARDILVCWGSPNLAEIRKSLGEPAERQVAPVPATRRFINNPVQIAECGGPCADGGPEACDCGALWCDAPAPAPAGEVGEVVRWLRKFAVADILTDETADRLYAAADLLEQHQAAPVPAGEVAELVAWLHGQDGGIGRRAIYARIADLLERQAAPVPVAISERLPGPEDCESHGWCWVLYRGYSTWALEPPCGQDGMPTGWTHWLPAHALPLPSGEIQS